MVSPPPKPTFFTLKTTLAPLNQAYVCKTHHRAADTRLRETTKNTNTTNPQKTQKQRTQRNTCFL